MKLEFIPQIDKNADLHFIREKLEFINQSLEKDKFGEIREVIVGVICVKNLVKHLLPERRTLFQPEIGRIIIEVSLDFDFVMDSDRTRIWLTLVEKVTDKLDFISKKNPDSFFNVGGLRQVLEQA